MKKIFVLGMAVLMVVGFAGVSMAAAVSNLGDHDVNNTGCAGCHTPHGAKSTMGPLWDQTVTTQIFTMYDSDTIDSDISNSLPDGVSKLCLSCHDGLTAIDATGSPMTTGGALGKALDNDHPISFTYDATLVAADGGLAVPDILTGTVGATPLPLFDYGIAVDQLECATCHNVHDSTDGFLRMSNAGSALCLNCHINK